MADKEIVKEYTNGDLTIVWKPGKCIHAGECVKALPQVYNPKEKPWIKAENATTEELKAQIGKCPSGALSYYVKGERAEEVGSPTQVNVMHNGPLIVIGKVEVTASDGTREVRNKRTAFCRCGASKKKPYCDGTHGDVGFVG